MTRTTYTILLYLLKVEYFTRKHTKNILLIDFVHRMTISNIMNSANIETRVYVLPTWLWVGTYNCGLLETCDVQSFLGNYGYLLTRTCFLKVTGLNWRSIIIM